MVLKRLTIIAGMALLTLTACEDDTPNNQIKGGSKSVFLDTYIFTDADTGCQYIQTVYSSYGVQVTPRLNSEGKPMCGKVGE